jgi:hypothetical protein
MSPTVVDPRQQQALELAFQGLDLLFEAGFEPASSGDARELIRVVEGMGRRVDAARVEVVDAVDRSGVYREDGHASAKVMVRHHAGLSGAEAARRAKAVRACRSLDHMRELWRSGTIGSCQVHCLARAFGNKRVRPQMVESETTLLRWAREQQFLDFDHLVRDWVRFVDEDGARDRNQAAHEQRDASLLQEFDGSFSARARCGSFEGATMLEIFRHFVDAEFRTDWDKARAEHGDAATVEDLPRTDAQRRFDALYEIFQQAASTPPGGTGPGVVLDVVIDQATFERQLWLLGGERLPRRSGAEFDAFRCSTLAGTPVDPTEAVASALVGHVRRVVVGGDGVVVDMGRRQRLFSGPAAVAARISTTHCYLPGCWVPVTDCQIDHLHPFNGSRGSPGGPTDQANAGPACGRHNRHKQAGYQVWRGPDGHWHVAKPDGTRLE